MLRFLQAILHSAMQCRPQQGLGKALALSAFEETYWLSGGEFVCEGINVAIVRCLNSEQFTRSGRCRATQHRK